MFDLFTDVRSDGGCAQHLFVDLHILFFLLSRQNSPITIDCSHSPWLLDVQEDIRLHPSRGPKQSCFSTTSRARARKVSPVLAG